MIGQQLGSDCAAIWIPTGTVSDRKRHAVLAVHRRWFSVGRPPVCGTECRAAGHARCGLISCDVFPAVGGPGSKILSTRSCRGAKSSWQHQNPLSSRRHSLFSRGGRSRPLVRARTRPCKLAFRPRRSQASPVTPNKRHHQIRRRYVSLWMQKKTTGRVRNDCMREETTEREESSASCAWTKACA